MCCAYHDTHYTTTATRTIMETTKKYDEYDQSGGYYHDGPGQDAGCANGGYSTSYPAGGEGGSFGFVTAAGEGPFEHQQQHHYRHHQYQHEPRWSSSHQHPTHSHEHPPSCSPSPGVSSSFGYLHLCMAQSVLPSKSRSVMNIGTLVLRVLLVWLCLSRVQSRWQFRLGMRNGLQILEPRTVSAPVQSTRLTFSLYPKTGSLFSLARDACGGHRQLSSEVSTSAGRWFGDCFYVELTDVSVGRGLGIDLFSTHAIPLNQRVISNQRGVTLQNGLFFAREPRCSVTQAIRVPYDPGVIIQTASPALHVPPASPETGSYFPRHGLGCSTNGA